MVWVYRVHKFAVISDETTFTMYETVPPGTRMPGALAGWFHPGATLVDGYQTKVR